MGCISDREYTVAQGRYALEHFYYGQVTAQRALQPLAASPGVSAEIVADAVACALIPPIAGSPVGSWALVRGRSAVPFVLVQAQITPNNLTMMHFIILTPDVLRSASGNLGNLLTLVEPQMPTFEAPGKRLPPIALAEVAAPSNAQQVDDILDLMTFTRNRMPLIEQLLSAIVQGIPLVVQAAPPELETRIKFIQGLLALLPPSARFGVTFATHTMDYTAVDTQIRFHAGERLSRQMLVFHWERAKTGGNVVMDDYSHYITSQLRLDAELVAQQTLALTNVAAWRIRRGETLAQAMGYGATRLRLDESILNNQPVEVADVSRVLAEDPTLSDDLKIAYTRHLLAFALALGDMGYADPIAVTLRQQPELEIAVQNQFIEAVNDGQAGIVYDALDKWMGNPLGPVGMKWVELTHRAALTHLDSLVAARDVGGLNTFLEQIHHAEPGLEISRIVPKIVEKTLPLAMLDSDLNMTIFLLAVNYLDSDLLRRMVISSKFTAQLPSAFVRLVPYLTGQDAGIAPPGIVLGAAETFGEGWQNLILIRMSEMAVRAGRPDLIDTPELSSMIGLIQTAWGAQYSQTLAWIASNMSTDEVLERLEPPGPTYILQLLLAFGAYAELATEMTHQARMLYPGDRQGEYINTVRRLFAETYVQTEFVPAALEAVTRGGIRSVPLAMAYIGALEGHEWSSALDPVADSVTQMMFENPSMLEFIPPQAMIALLRFHIKRKDVNKTIKVAGLLPAIATREGERGVNLIGRMYKLLDWDDRVRLAALELLRRYVRQSDDEIARRAVAAFGREFGVGVQQAMEATIALKWLLDGMNLYEYAQMLHRAAEFLHDTAAAYSDKTRLPTSGAVLGNLNSMPGNLSDEECNTVATDCIGLGRVTLVLGDHARQTRPRDAERFVDMLLVGQVAPVTPLDAFWAMGGYLTKGKRYPLRMERVLKHPLGERDIRALRDDLNITNHLLRAALRAFPPDKKLTISVESIRGAMDSLWGEVPLAQQREIVRDLAIDLQRIAALPAIIAADGNVKALEDGSMARKLEEGKQQPKNTLELYRYVAGFFRARVT